jgi:ATP-binding cassette subfamily B multidrug efflux pump
VAGTRFSSPPDSDGIRLFVSHDLDAHRWADRIVVLKDGSLVEQGSHEQLVKQGGAYARLYRAHLGKAIEE